MTYEELILSIPTNGVICLWNNQRVLARSMRGPLVLIESDFNKVLWVGQSDISPLPESKFRPMTDREIFGLLAQDAIVVDCTGTKYKGWDIGKSATAFDQYINPNSTEWLPCTVEMME